MAMGFFIENEVKKKIKEKLGNISHDAFGASFEYNKRKEVIFNVSIIKNEHGYKAMISNYEKGVMVSLPPMKNLDALLNEVIIRMEA